MTAEDDEHWDGYVASILRPPRPGFAEAKALAECLRREAMPRGRRSIYWWCDLALEDRSLLADVEERMATALGGEWLADGRRLFLPTTNPPLRPWPDGRVRYPRASTLQRRRDPRPWNLETLVALLGAGEAAVRTVESVALEAAAGMVPWGLPAASRVAWCVLDPSWTALESYDENYSSMNGLFQLPLAAVSGRLAFDRPAPIASAVFGLPEEQQVDAALRRSPAGAGPRRTRVGVEARRAAVGAAQWRHAAAYGARANAVDLAPDHLRWNVHGCLIADLPDVPAAVLEVWKLGYVLLDLEGDTVYLGAPWDGPPLSAPSVRRWRSAVANAGLESTLRGP